MCFFKSKKSSRSSSRPSISMSASSLPAPPPAPTFVPPVSMPTQAAPATADVVRISSANQKKTGRRSLVIPLLAGGGSGLNIPG